jgi:flagellar protein FlaJ
MTVLSTTNIDRMEVFRKLANEEEYGALADEISRVVELVDTWNQSLDDALRRRAKEVPSKPLSDFFDRLAYTLSAGQDLSDFLLSEQSTVIQNYVTIYEGALDNLEVMKDLYLSMILSMTFGLVFAVVLPILTGTDPTITVAAVIVLFVFVQLGFAYAIKTVVPYDPVWFQSDEIKPRKEPLLRMSLLGGVALSLVLLVVTAGDIFNLLPIGFADLLPVKSIPLPIYLAIPLTPLAIPGLVVRRTEQAIKGRDGEFPSFIRALGASESAKQSTTSAVLKDLRRKDFGPLTPDVNNLYKRLNMRIEAMAAWHNFSADTQSYLIQKFSEMYLIGRQMGGNPKQLGELISENMNSVLQLRERRDQGTVTLIGLLYGITAAATFAFFIGLQVVRLLAGMSMSLDPGANQFDFSQLISTQSYDIPTIQFLLLVVVLFNALLSSLMIRTVDGGHKMNAYLHFVALVWIGVIVAVATKMMTGAFLNI